MKIGKGVKPGMLVRWHGEWLHPWNGRGKFAGAFQTAEAQTYMQLDGKLKQVSLPDRLVIVGKARVTIR